MNLHERGIKVARSTKYSIFYSSSFPEFLQFGHSILRNYPEKIPNNLISIELFDELKLEFGLNIFEHYNLTIFSERIDITGFPIADFNPLKNYVKHNPMFYRFTIKVYY